MRRPHIVSVMAKLQAAKRVKTRQMSGPCLTIREARNKLRRCATVGTNAKSHLYKNSLALTREQAFGWSNSAWNCEKIP